MSRRIIGSFRFFPDRTDRELPVWRCERFYYRNTGNYGRTWNFSIQEAEPIGPKGLLDILVIAPCTGNTMAKLAAGITDTPVLMAAKAHMRNDKPVVLSPATNDALGASLKNIGFLMNTKISILFRLGRMTAKRNRSR